MQKVLLYFIILLSLAASLPLAAQEMPLVYDVENTGAECPPPFLPAFGDLPVIPALPDPFAWSDGRGRVARKSH